MFVTIACPCFHCNDDSGSGIRDSSTSAVATSVAAGAAGCVHPSSLGGAQHDVCVPDGAFWGRFLWLAVAVFLQRQPVRKTPFFEQFSIQKGSFYQDRLGTNIGKTQKRGGVDSDDTPRELFYRWAFCEDTEKRMIDGDHLT